MYKQDLALNNLQGLICCETQTPNQSVYFSTDSFTFNESGIFYFHVLLLILFFSFVYFIICFIFSFKLYSFIDPHTLQFLYK